MNHEYNCGGGNGAGVVCSLRKSPENHHSLSSAQGTVIMDGTFICSDFWTVPDAQVACRELGYPYMLHVKETEKNDTSVPGFTEFACRGDELFLSKCIHLESNKTCENNLAAVECSNSVKGLSNVHQYQLNN